jgi:hypothetical protein
MYREPKSGDVVNRRIQAMPAHPRRSIRRKFLAAPQARSLSGGRISAEQAAANCARQAVAKENMLASAAALSTPDMLALASELIQLQKGIMMMHRDDRL